MGTPRIQKLGDHAATITKTAAAVAILWGSMRFIVRASDAVALAQTSAVRVDSLKIRVNGLETQLNDVAYMTCVTFAETHPPMQVPATCDRYTRPR